METVEKQTTFSHRSHSAWKTRQPLASFPQFPQSLLLVQHKSKKPNQLIALTNYSCTSNLNRRLVIFHFSVSIWKPRSLDRVMRAETLSDMENEKWKMTNNSFSPVLPALPRSNRHFNRSPRRDDSPSLSIYFNTHHSFCSLNKNPFHLLWSELWIRLQHASDD